MSVLGYVRTVRYTSNSRCWTTRHLFLPTRWHLFPTGHVRCATSCIHLTITGIWGGGGIQYYGFQIPHLTQCVVTLKAFCYGQWLHSLREVNAKSQLHFPGIVEMLANTWQRDRHMLCCYDLCRFRQSGLTRTFRLSQYSIKFLSSEYIVICNICFAFWINNTYILCVWRYLASMARATHQKARECLEWVRSEGTTPRSEETPRTGTQTLSWPRRWILFAAAKTIYSTYRLEAHKIRRIFLNI
jgi:hypothetical protein